MSAALIARLRVRGAALAPVATQALKRRVAQRWQDIGGIDESGETLRLAGRGLIGRRRGTRQRLPDPLLLWPGEE
jgi:hypothetical protein